MNDISGLENITELANNATTKKWIKLISTDKTSSYSEYVRKNDFKLVANIELDNEIHTSGKNNGKKKRNTLIIFKPTIDKEEFNNKTEWIYIFTINDRIVKIGGTRTGLKERAVSYLCGHHIAERGKSGDCSKTNGFIYNTFEFYLHLDCTIQMYAYQLPKTQFEIEIFGEKTMVTAQTYHAYESRYLEDYKKHYGYYPVLSDNCDPNYKE